MSPPLPANVADVTNYTFHAPVAVGSRVTVRPVSPLGTGEQLRAAAQAYAYGVGDFLGARDLVVSPADVLPGAGEYATVSGRLPADPGRPQESSLRAAFIRLDTGSVSVEYIARADDPRAEQQFQEIVRSVRPAAAANPVLGALESVSGVRGPDGARQAGSVKLALPPEFRGPTAAVLATADQRVTFEMAGGVAAASPTTAHKLFGTLATATGDDGRPVRYEVAPTGPAPAMGTVGGMGGFELTSTPPAAAPATQDTIVNGLRVRSIGAAPATDLFNAVVEQIRSRQ